jgi:hypothetical protein
MYLWPVIGLCLTADQAAVREAVRQEDGAAHAPKLHSPEVPTAQKGGLFAATGDPEVPLLAPHPQVPQKPCATNED